MKLETPKFKTFPELFNSLKASGHIWVEAGSGIKAGSGIEAGGGITCKTLSSKLRIFAGLCLWRLPEKEETLIKCEKLIEGDICFGELVITEEEKKTITVAANGKEVEISIESAKSLGLV